MAIVGNWNFNNDANDSVGAKHFTGYGAQLAHKPLNGWNGCYYFNRNDGTSYLQQNARIINTTSYSIIVWVKFTWLKTATVGYGNWIVNQRNNPAAGDYQLYASCPVIGSSSIGFNFADTGGIYNAVILLNSTPVLNKWYQLGISLKHSDILKGYLNGVKVAELDVTGKTARLTSTTTTIGRAGWGGQDFEGNIDELKVYNNPLSDADFKNNYLYYKGFF